MSHINKWLFAVLTVMFCVTANATELPRKNKAMEKAAEQASQVTISPDMMERVNSIMTTMETPEWKKKMAEMQKLAAAPLGIDVEEEEASSNRLNGTKHRLYLFISKSVPLETLRNYARDLEKVPGGVMVLRGFVKSGQTLSPTARFVASILRKDRYCEGLQCEMRKVEIQIDPYLYRKYQITRVPAVTFEEKANPDGYCSANVAEMKADNEVILVQGDAALRYAVDTIYQETKKPILKRIIEQLEGDG